MFRRQFSALVVASALAVAAIAGCAPPSAPDFVAQAAMNNLYLIESGEVAAAKGQSEAVKQFGQYIAEQHRKFNEELKSILQAEKVDVEMPDALDEAGQGRIKALNEAKSEEFDALYAQQQVNALKRAVSLFDAYAESGTNEALKQFAANVLPALKRNRDRAKKLTR